MVDPAAPIAEPTAAPAGSRVTKTKLSPDDQATTPALPGRSDYYADDGTNEPEPPLNRALRPRRASAKRAT
ncbi:hypothetical protein SH611_20695 [Geminicoccaceae bacterium 1502E]|nr:hypothetical protein [Geminicoccaceae bacterium 1502E]